ncbi:MAG TPA: 3-hydroxyacyl-CoA dehydrogenase NAD-binding domain-containing protein [Streptosporangiaceae bacterium]
MSVHRVSVAAVGAGTMGAGIAQIAAAAGHPVLIYDAVPGAAAAAIEKIRDRVARRGNDPSALNLTAVPDLAGLAPAQVVVEAVVEDLTVKRALFADLERVVSPGCVLATNTSSLSPTAIARDLLHPERFVGLHFFNPVPAMKLAEVIPGLATGTHVADTAAALAESWGKTVVRASATPGFIVNRIARPFYGEAWRLYEEGAADPATIDAVLTGCGGFRMGPFALMDLIGHDVNEAVTRSVWSEFGFDSRYTPSLAQRALTDAGWLGRKSGRGVYDYRDGGTPPAAVPAPPAPFAAVPAAPGDELTDGTLLLPSTGRTAAELAVMHGVPVVVTDRALNGEAATAVAVAASPDTSPRALHEAIGMLQELGRDVYVIDDVPGLIVTRTVAMLVNAGYDALQHRVASAADIDSAMRLGLNYPAGPLEWGDRWGLPAVLDILDALHRAEGDPRYRASTLLRRRACGSPPVNPV